MTQEKFRFDPRVLPEKAAQEERPYLPMIYKGREEQAPWWEKYGGLEVVGRERAKAGEPLRWWEYDRPTIESAVPAPQLPSWYTPTTTYTPQPAGEVFPWMLTNDWYLWGLEEMRYGISRWKDEWGLAWEDSLETVTSQKEKEGWRSVVEPIKHAVMGGISLGLMRGAGPVLNIPQYLVERGIGWSHRKISTFNVDTGEPHGGPGWTPFAKEFAEKFDLKVPSEEYFNLNDWLKEEYGYDEEVYNKSLLAAQEADRISFTWMKDANKFKRIIGRLMTEAKTNDDIERILKEEQSFLKEIVLGMATDPLNILAWKGWKPIQTANSRKVVQLASQPIDETLDLGQTARKVGGYWRTPRAMARRTGEVVHDRLATLLKDVDSVDAMPERLINFLADPAYDSVHGQMVKRVLEEMPVEDIFKGLDKTDNIRDAVEVITKNVGKRAWAAEYKLIRNTKVGRAYDDFAKVSMKWQGLQRKILSPLFLGWNPQYLIGNWWDNMRNIQTRIGWRRIPGANLLDNLGFSRKAAEAFFTDKVGAIPRRLVQGFSVTPAELRVGVDVAEETASIWRKVWKVIKRGPTLALSGKIEENASAMAITQSYIGRWSRNWNEALPRLPVDLVDELTAINPNLVDAIQSAGLGKYNYGAIRKELDAMEGIMVAGAEVQGRLFSPGWYIQQLTKDERAAVLAHPDIVAEVNKLSGVTSEVGRRAIIDGLRDMIGTGMEAVASQKHVDDLMTVGWGHRSAKIMELTEPVTHRWESNPLVMEMLEKGAHDFDFLRRIADTYGVDVLDLCEPMDEVAFEIIRRGGNPSELWQYYDDAYPILSKYYPEQRQLIKAVGKAVPKVTKVDVVEVAPRIFEPRIVAEKVMPELDDLLQLAAEDGVVDTMTQLTRFDDITPARSRDAFFDLYKSLMPQARHQIIQDIPDVGVIRTTPSFADEATRQVVTKMKAWITNHPGAIAEDWDELQQAMTLAKRYMWYKTGAEDWTKWANSSWEINRLPDKLPNLYDIYRVYKGPLDSAIDKLDTRSFRDLDVSMEVPPTLWKRVVDWFDTSVKKDMELTQYTTIRQALADKDYSILDYGDKSLIDVLLGLVIPYEFWTTRSMWNWGKYLFDHPAIASKLTRYQAQMEAQMVKDPLVPNRLKGWFPMGIQGAYNFLTDKAWTADTEHYVRPERILMPLELMPIFGDTYLPDNYQDITRGKEWLLINNSWSTSPILFDGLALLANNSLPWFDEHQPEWAERIRRYIPDTALETGAAYWSGTRGIRGGSIVLEPLLNKMGINVPPEGLNPEGTIHEWLGMARVAPTETYWRYQWLGNLAGTGEITSKEAAEAFHSRSGRAWDLAVRQAAEQTAVPSFYRWATYAPIKTYPSEERVMRGIGIIYRECYERYEAGDRDALREFYAVYPDYRFRQLAFRYWDVASGEMTEEDWDDWLVLNSRVNEYYQERGDLEREREVKLGTFYPGTPEHYRTRSYFSAERRKLNDTYGPELNEYFDYLAENRKKYINWRDGPKAQAMRSFLDRWYKADSDVKQEMLENLPQTMLEVAMEARGSTDPRLFTALEARQEIARRDEPVDAVYRELNNQAARVWDIYYTDWWMENQPVGVQDKYVVYLEMDFPMNVEYREGQPDLNKAVEDYDVWRDELLERDLDPTAADFIAAIKVLHPDWDEDKIAEATKIGKRIGSFKVADYTYIKGSDRDMIISELWRFWTTLPAKSLARKRAKEILGPRFGELFLGGEYNQISNTELALWLNLMPTNWESLIPEGRKPPFGEGPMPPSQEMLSSAARWYSWSLGDMDLRGEDFVPPEPEDREKYRFAPAARVEKAIPEEQAKEEAMDALEKAREQLRAGEPVGRIELPSPAEEKEYQTAYGLLQRALEGDTDLWDDPLVKKWFPPNSPSRRFWQFWYDSVPPGELGKWAKEHGLLSAILDTVSREYITEEAYEDAVTFLLEELPKHDIGDPREYEQARAEAETYYALVTPELEHLRSIYFSLPSGKGVRRAFLEEYPQLLGLFDAQNAFKAAHPVFTKYYDLDWVPPDERYEASAGGAGWGGGGGTGTYKGQTTSGISWKVFIASAGPLVMGELLQYWNGRGQLSSSARAHLKKIWRKSNSDMSFDDWLDYLKRLWLYFGTRSFKSPRAPRVYIPGVGSGTLRAAGRARWRIER